MLGLSEKNTRVSEAALSASKPAFDITGARQIIRAHNTADDSWLIVLDDDPTGCQTVYNVPIITSWETELLKKTIASEKFFFILTNSRAYPSAEAASINQEIVERLINIVGSNRTRIISRSDSTLRGHFLEETTSILATAGPYDALILIPYFREGNRFTRNDTHYVVENNHWIEAHRTEFASDAVFGYENSWLPGWIEERSKGRWLKENVMSLSIEMIRNGGVDAVYDMLKACENERPVVVNALTDEDVELVVLAICKAEMEGKRFLYRSAASFVKIRAGIEDVPLYTPPQKLNKGMIIVGSYVQKTTEQVKPLLDDPDIEKIEISIQGIFSSARNAYLISIVHQLESVIKEGKSVMLYTERSYGLAEHADKLASGKSISAFLSDIVHEMKCRPDFIIAKGGITSHDIATKGLAMKKAQVLGQIAPGVPVWQAAGEAKFPGLLYVVFPGNVGDGQTLKDVFSKMQLR